MKNLILILALAFVVTGCASAKVNVVKSSCVERGAIDGEAQETCVVSKVLK